MTYDEMLCYADNLNIDIVEAPFIGSGKGYTIDTTIFINSNLSMVERKCTLAEEISHFEISHGNIIELDNIKSKKQEIFARNKGYGKIVKIFDLIAAFEKGYTKYELAEHLGITDEFLNESISYYKKKYGTYLEIDEYTIIFEPNLYVGKKIGE